MNGRFLTYLINIFALVGVTTSYAPVGIISEWVKESSGKREYVITCSDLHFDNGNQKNTDKQRKDIIEIAKRKKALVIVEDLTETVGVLQQSVEASNGRAQAISIYNRNHNSNVPVHASLLHYMTQACKQAGVDDCINVEFRHYLLPHKSPKLPSEEDPQYQEEVQRVCATIPVPHPHLKDVTAVLKSVVDEVSHYNGPLTEYYASVLSKDKVDLLNYVLKVIDHNIETEELKNIECNERTFSRLVKRILEQELKISASHGRAQEMSDVNRYLDKFDEALDSVLEARIMYHIAHSKAKTVLVCAGGKHIKEMTPGLKALGYKHKKTTRGNGGAIDIADYFDLDIKMEEPDQTPAITARRSPWRFFCMCATAAAVSMLGYLGYQYWYNRLFAH